MSSISGSLADIGEWVRTGGTLGVLALLLGFWLRKKRDDREGWGALITALQQDIVTVRGQHSECERRLTDVEAQLRGVHRQLVTQAGYQTVSLGEPSDMVKDAAARAARIVGEEDPPGTTPTPDREVK